MTKTIWAAPIGTAVLALALAAPLQSARAAGSLCTSPQKAIFSCDIGRKIVSICASPDFSDKAGGVQYRFGPQGKPEMVLPKNSESRQGVTAGREGNMERGVDFARFRTGANAYAVYDLRPDGGKEQWGVSVEKSGKQIADLHCKGAPTGSLFDLIGVLPDDPDGF